MATQDPLVTICIPFSRNPYPDWSISLASILPPFNGSVGLRRTINMERGEARDYLVEQSIKDRSKFTLFLDDDVTVPPNILRDLLFQIENADDDVMVIGGIYCSKTTPPQPLVFKTLGDGPFYKWKLNQVFECEAIATGMMLIRNEVFSKISKPWFRDIRSVEEAKEHNLIPIDSNIQNFEATDDVFFCRKVTEAGYKILAHGGVHGMHWNDDGTVFTLPIDSYPFMEFYLRKYGKEKTSEHEYTKRVMGILKHLYGPLDLLPIENDKHLSKFV